MSNRITAQEAFVVTTNSYDVEMTAKVEDFLSKVYNKINTAAKRGLFAIGLDIGNSGSHYRKAAQILEADGYDVSVIDCERCYYMTIRWRNPTNS